jgi:hypothetical protein
LMNNYYFGSTKFHFNPKHGFESENKFGRLFGKNQFFNAFAGFELNREEHHAENMWENEFIGFAGFEYTLPMFVKAEGRVDHKGKFLLQFEREDLALSKRLRFNAMWNTDKEYEVGLKYIVSKRWQLSGNYYNHYGFGAGMTFNY